MTNQTTATVRPATVKFFRNGKTLSAFCRMRYGQSKLIWADPVLVHKEGQWAVSIDLAEVDKKFPPKNAAVC